MYYVEAVVKIRVEEEMNAEEPYWLREAIEAYLEGEEEVVYISKPIVINEGEKWNRQ
jgi:predicted DNA-binding protein